MSALIAYSIPGKNFLINRHAEDRTRHTKSDWGLCALLLELHMNHMCRGERVNKNDQLQMASCVQ